MTIYQYIADRIKQFRKDYGNEGISQEALAEAISVAPNTVSRWETGTYKPKVQDIEILAKFFGKPLASFFPPQEWPNPEKDVALSALLSATADLTEGDIKEIANFAEYRKARALLEKKK